MRRAQSVRHQPRASLASAVDDLGVLREDDGELGLRRQLLEKDRENDKLRTQIQVLQAQLSQRPSVEEVEELNKEYRNLELILQGTQRENERCMAEIDRGKLREKMLEGELTKLAGANWQSTLDIASNNPTPTRSGTLLRNGAFGISTPPPSAPDQGAAVGTAVQQLRMLVLGMEQRIQNSEEKLKKDYKKAEMETHKFEQLSRQLAVD